MNEYEWSRNRGIHICKSQWRNAAKYVKINKNEIGTKACHARHTIRIKITDDEAINTYNVMSFTFFTVFNIIFISHGKG